MHWFLLEKKIYIHIHIKGSSVYKLQWYFSSPGSFPVLLGFILCHYTMSLYYSLALPTHPSRLCPQPINPLSFFIIIGVVCWVSVSLPMPPPSPVILKVSMAFVLALAWHVSRLERVYTEWQIWWSVRELGRAWECFRISTVGFNLLSCGSTCQRHTV